MIAFLTFLVVFVAVVSAFGLFQHGVERVAAWFFPKYDPRRQERAAAARLRDGRRIVPFHYRKGE